MALQFERIYLLLVKSCSVLPPNNRYPSGKCRLSTNKDEKYKRFGDSLFNQALGIAKIRQNLVIIGLGIRVGCITTNKLTLWRRRKTKVEKTLKKKRRSSR
jgi:hypothetical protein